MLNDDGWRQWKTFLVDNIIEFGPKAADTRKQSLWGICNLIRWYVSLSHTFMHVGNNFSRNSVENSETLLFCLFVFLFSALASLQWSTVYLASSEEKWNSWKIHAKQTLCVVDFEAWAAPRTNPLCEQNKKKRNIRTCKQINKFTPRWLDHVARPIRSIRNCFWDSS